MALFFYKEKNKDIRAAAYLRLSIEDGDKAESNSIGNQRELIRDFAAERPGLHLVEEYADDGYTGTNFERPGFKRMMEDAAGTLPLDTYKQKKQECDRRISEVQEQIEQFKAEESVQSVVPGTVRAAAEQAENFLNGTRLTAGMVSAFIENVFVHDGGRIVVRFKYEQSIQDTVKALHTG